MTERILILAPRGRDAEVVAKVLESRGVASEICPDLAAVRVHVANDFGGLLVTEEALTGPDLGPLLDWCDSQPPWSDTPVIVMATRRAGTRAAVDAGVLERLGNVVLLERPVNAETLARAARSSIRVRRRQYQARSTLRELRDLNDTLERRVEERAQELDRAHDALAFALDSAGMGSWDLDIPTDTCVHSAQYDRIFGDAVAPNRSGWGRFLHHVVEEDRPLAEDARTRARATGSFDLKCRIERRGGGIGWIEAKGRVGYDAAGAPVRMTGVVMDATDRRLTEDALHQAQKMEAIGQLTGGVAHDFNNLLTVIVGGLDMMIRRPEQTARVLRLAEAAMTAARRGEQLTQQLLAFSRRQMLRPQTLNPNRLLLEVESLARRAVGEAVSLTFELDPAAGAIRVDPAQFGSAVLNLIVNARDAVAGGNGAILVTTSNVDRRTGAACEASLPAGPLVRVSVGDNGSGLDEATMARAFEPFFTTKEVGKGSGLGLSQVYGFARSAGGDVKIVSEVGQGTTVSLFFPRSTEASADEDAAAPGTAPLRPATANELILVVEDDEDVLGMAIESLEELHYRVIVARNAREALGHINGPERIDLMFSDVVMPGGMNGAQLAAEARRLRPEMRVLLTSGYVGEAGSDARIGTDVEVLSKPYRRDELAGKLRAVLDRP